ncbi:MAG: MlaD family protein [Acidaminococcales bacterium]|jgi:phospholipid/cholesterol/gamma-HCH transport system substrate-binding protein|nr:MlaD family protein [Acidaminococcales bacterium]
MNNETKVGMVVIAGLAILMGIITFLGFFRFSADSYLIAIRFQRAGGLKPGNIVHFVGVPVGQVDEIKVDGNDVIVSASIKNGVKIPAGSSFWLGSEGVMGSMYVDIDPPRTVADRYLQPGDEVWGSPGASMNDFMVAASGVLQKLEAMADALNVVFGDKEVQESIMTTMRNTKEITSNINGFTRVFAELAGENREEINKMIRQMSDMALQMNQAAERVNKLLTQIDGNGQTGREIADILRNLKKTSENVEKITKSVENMTGDAKTQDDIRETIKNARQVSEKANKLLGTFSGGEKAVSFDIKYADKPDKYRVDANFRVNYAPSSFWLLGVSDIGEANDVNLQVGYGTSKAALRGGLVLGDVGAGVDYAPLKWLRLFADAYDPNDFKIRVGGEIRLSEKISLVGESLNVRKKADNTAYVGLRGYF